MISPRQPFEDPLSDTEKDVLRAEATKSIRSCSFLPGKRYSRYPRAIFSQSAQRISNLEQELYRLKTSEPSADLKWLFDNLRLVRTDLGDLHDAIKVLARLPQCRGERDEPVPRCIVLARGLLQATQNRLTEAAFAYFVESVQLIEALRLSELGALIPALKLVLITAIATDGWAALKAFQKEGAGAASSNIGPIIVSLRFIGEIGWKETIEGLSIIDRVLRRDPSAVYPRMDFESREAYRRAVAKLAARSDVSEAEVARIAVDMAQSASADATEPDALRARLHHVGYYLVDPDGAKELHARIGYRSPLSVKFENLFRNNPDEFYIIGIEFLSLIVVALLIMSIVQHHEASGLIVGALLLILPATQAAVEVMNNLVTAALTPRALPKIDFSEHVDPDCATMVAVPTLLINEKQIGQLVDDIEVRYLVNRDPNICYALLTDLPDSAEPAEERDTRVDLAIRLIEGLNKKYSKEPYGGFYLFHRHRVYNPREGAWMGFERKRGKLLDLNQYLRGVFDPFPVKSGDLSRLPPIRYVLTLDSDTQLPRGSAQKLIGAMAHPLNRPLIDPELNIVTTGYGILQPRVGISVQSASRSRLASIYSGQTGFDIYSRAVSDVYQDLYGEGIFTGKGIYDVDALRQVLEHRFPRNSLLSHDLIEGAYSRAGLASDVEVIDDYPSHYSAYNRRRHRWLRGDWQIVRWIFNTVPDESRRPVSNPISLVSRWKIVDNLRRSLIEPATFLLLLAGWFVLPAGPRFWTVVTLALLFLPIYFRLIFAVIRSAFTHSKQTFREAFIDFFTSHISVLLNIAFLSHQALVAMDAIIRTMVRSYFTHRSLLEWETATEAELGTRKRTPVDIYLDWVPALAVLLGLALFLKPGAAPYALPFIVAWACSPLLSKWLNRSPHSEEEELGRSDRQFLRQTALRTWRYFATFSNERNHWLIPDNVQEDPDRIAERISPTNLGFLLNARQAALEFGYITVSEFAAQTAATLATVAQLRRQFGHFLNWYDNISLKPLEPQFVSSVDSGNLAASLWALKQGCTDLLHQPIIRKNAIDGLVDHFRMAGRANSLPAWNGRRTDEAAWLPRVLSLSIETETSWWPGEIETRIEALRCEAQAYLPWLLPEYEPLRKLPAEVFCLPAKPLTLETASSYYREVENRLAAMTVTAGIPSELSNLMTRLREALAGCRERAHALAVQLRDIAERSDRLVREMDFSALSDKRRNLLSIGYQVDAGQLSKSCYDLLGSEARIAAFIAVAKGDVPEENWFRLGRQHTRCESEYVLISWTGTMFEYLMAAIWMKSHPDTLLDRAVRAAVRAQQAYAANRRVPWGISEAAFSERDADGNYQYAAFGVPCLGLSVARRGTLVISPYSSCLALQVDPITAVRNLRYMAKRKWLGKYGFYESADYTKGLNNRFLAPQCELVRCWMAHHQGMSLTSLSNVFHNNVFQRWFHAEPLVQASELILQERPLRVRPITDSQPRLVLPFTKRANGRRPASAAKAQSA
jgi:cyclic beta-1,2-glucan glucanotransferase